VIFIWTLTKRLIISGKSNQPEYSKVLLVLTNETAKRFEHLDDALPFDHGIK
jgi:hypothetical protein